MYYLIIHLKEPKVQEELFHLPSFSKRKKGS